MPRSGVLGNGCKAMQVSFGRFELDEGARALRLDGQDQALQPLVFDLLAYLVRHRERVVPKEELLSQLWVGVIVTDGSLQRAVSLLRGVAKGAKSTTSRPSMAPSAAATRRAPSALCSGSS